MKVEFYFDLSCPFSWITSRWLTLVVGQRDVDVNFIPFSLALKNGEIEGGDTTEHTASHRKSHRVLRVMAAAREKGTSFSDLYTSFGTQHFTGDKHDYNDELIQAVLSQNDLPAELSQAADNPSFDDELREYMQPALDTIGQDIGVPSIVFENTDGSRNGYFGPVLMKMPELNDALKLWDGLSSLATDDNFYELKRDRPNGGPDVTSTALG